MKANWFLIAAALLGFCACSGNAPQSTDNQVIDAIMNRRSIRKYEDKAVPRELLEKIAICGVNAPNAINAQKWEVRIVDSPEYIDGISKLFVAKNPEAASKNTYFKNIFRNAPAIICVAAEPWRWSGVNCGLMGENMMLAAYSLGLGTCCLGGPVDFIAKEPDARKYLDALCFSEGYELQFILAVGYPDETPDARPRDLSKVKFVDFI